MNDDIAMGATGFEPQQTSVLIIEPEAIREAPMEPDKLAQQWQKKITKAKKHWQWFYDRCRYNCKLVANYDEKAKADDPKFLRFKVNLIESTIRAIMPNLYARNPEISIKARRSSDEARSDVIKFCDTLQEVLNAYLEKAELKVRGKAVVRAALTCSYGILKVCYQRDLASDPIIQSRLQDAQDNLARIDGLASRLEDDETEGLNQAETIKQELAETIVGYQQDAEPQQIDGLVIDRVPTDQFIIDPTIRDFDDYDKADWMCQCVPMSRGYVEETYKIKIGGAAVYEDSAAKSMDSARDAALRGERTPNADDQVMVWEIWDRKSQRVYTMCDGCSYFLKEPDSPQKVGGRWYPFFLLPFGQVTDKFVGSSLVDLMEGLQEEHNKIRDTQETHRDFCKPGYLASADVDEKSIERFASSELGEITILKNADGQDLRQIIMPKQYPPIDQALYDTTAVRQDIEQVTGMQDAMRSSVVQPKTATEAQIMQQGLSGRVAAFRDQVEDFLQQVAQYSAQVLLQELSEEDVQEVMGHADPIADPVTGMLIQPEQPYLWPKLSAVELSKLIRVKIEAGSTGAPNKLQEQENWGKVLPTILQLVQSIYQIKGQGMDATPLETLLTETCRRFDDRIDPKTLIPAMPVMQQAMPTQAPTSNVQPQTI